MMVRIIITAVPNMYDMSRMYMQSHNIHDLKGERFTLRILCNWCIFATLASCLLMQEMGLVHLAKS